LLPMLLVFSLIAFAILVFPFYLVSEQDNASQFNPELARDALVRMIEGSPKYFSTLHAQHVRIAQIEKEGDTQFRIWNFTCSLDKKRFFFSLGAPPDPGFVYSGSFFLDRDGIWKAKVEERTRFWGSKIVKSQ